MCPVWSVSSLSAWKCIRSLATHKKQSKDFAQTGQMPVLIWISDRRTGHFSCHMTKPTKWPVCPAKTQISMGIRLVWSKSSLSAWKNIGPSLPIERTVKTDQTGRMPRMIWVFPGCTCHFVGFVLRWLFFWFCCALAHLKVTKCHYKNFSVFTR